jgi:hypothetical protein
MCVLIRPNAYLVIARVAYSDYQHELQGGLVPNKISGVGTNFRLLVHVLPGPNKKRACKPRILMS